MWFCFECLGREGEEDGGGEGGRKRREEEEGVRKEG